MEKILNPTFFIPDIAYERGEIERVSMDVFQDPNTNDFFLRFLEAARKAPLVPLSKEMWKKLENTDSYEIASQDWASVAGNSAAE